MDDFTALIDRLWNSDRFLKRALVGFLTAAVCNMLLGLPILVLLWVIGYMAMITYRENMS